MKTLKKIGILSLGVLSISLAANLVRTAAAQQPVVDLKVALFTPPAGIVNVQMKRIKERIENESGGKIRLNIFESGQLGPAPRQYDLVRTGVADIALVLVTLTPGRFPLTELATVPNLVEFQNESTVSAALSSAFLENAKNFLAKEHEGVRLVNIAITPSQIFLTRGDVDSLDKIKGLRIRHGGNQYIETIKAFDAVPISVNPTELAEALARGRIDGVLGLFSTITTFHLQDSAKNVVPVPSGGLVFTIVMNATSYERIPHDLKPLVDKYFGSAVQPEWSVLFIDEEIAARKQIEGQGVKVHSLSDADRQKAKATTKIVREKIVAEVAAKGHPADSFVAAIQASVKKYPAGK